MNAMSRKLIVLLVFAACGCGGRSKLSAPRAPGADAAVVPPGPDGPSQDRPTDRPGPELATPGPDLLPVDRPPPPAEVKAELPPAERPLGDLVPPDGLPPSPDGLPDRPGSEVQPWRPDLPPMVADGPREVPPLIPDVPREAPTVDLLPDLLPDLPPVRPEVAPDLGVDLLPPPTDAWPPLPVCVDGAACTTGCSTACGMIGIMACGCNDGVLSCSGCQLLPITVSPEPCPGDPDGQECNAGAVACIAYRGGAIGGACLCMSPTAGGTLRWSCILQ